MEPPPKEVVAEIACHGFIGQTLHKSLLDILEEDNINATTAASVASAATPNEEEEEPTTASTATSAPKQQQLKLNPIIVDQVMQEFGNAVVRTNWKNSNTTSSIEKKSAASSMNNNNNKSPPTALLKGQLDHYNRIGSKWRIIVRNVQIRQKIPLPTNRKKRDRTSLWERGTLHQSACSSTNQNKKKQKKQTIGQQQQKQQEQSKSLCKSFDLQLLAYDDP